LGREWFPRLHGAPWYLGTVTTPIYKHCNGFIILKNIDATMADWKQPTLSSIQAPESLLTREENIFIVVTPYPTDVGLIAVSLYYY
jgi:hypothetical protein